MATYDSTHGSIVHVDVTSEDSDATRRFYESVFDWSFEPVPGMDYSLWAAPNPPSGGLMATDEEAGIPPSTTLYVQVDDLDAAADAITDAGGTLLMEEMSVEGMGVFTLFQDPGGVVAAAWEERVVEEQPDDAPRLTDDPEMGSIGHFEFYSDDLAATRALFESVFDWSFETDPDDEYTTVEPPTPPFGGLMETRPEWPAGTMCYVLVTDAASICETVADAGGEVLREPFAVGEWGTMAIVRAPGGIVQGVWERSTD